MGASQSAGRDCALNISISKSVARRIMGEEEPKKTKSSSPRKFRPKRLPEKNPNRTRVEELSWINLELRKILDKNSSRKSNIIPLKMEVQSDFCVEQKDDLMKCLQENKHEPLNCSRKFEDFTQCAHSKREEIKSY